MEYEQSVNTIDKGNIMDLQRKTFKYNCGSMLMLILGLLMLLFVDISLIIFPVIRNQAPW